MMNKRSFIIQIIFGVFIASALCALAGSLIIPVKAESPAPGQCEKIFFDGSVQDDSSSKASAHEIYCINPDGSHLVSLTGNTWDDRHPCVSPDRSKIAFLSNRRNQGIRIYVINADGTGPTPVSDNRVGYPAWSPDSSRIAFPGQKDGKSGLCVADILEGKFELIYEGVIDRPAWSLDGIWIFFSNFHDGNMSINTQTREIISVDEYTIVDPAVSPDNTRYAYFNDKKELFVTGKDGSNTIKILGPLRSTGDICWINCQPGQFESSVPDSYFGNWDAGRSFWFALVYGIPVFIVCFGIYWLVEKRRERKRLGQVNK